MRHISDNIRILRDMKGYSQDYMAAKMKLSRQAYGQMERGETKISEERLQNVADLLETTPDKIKHLDGTMSVIFEKCEQANVSTGSSTQTNHYSQEELQHQLEIARLENEKLQLQLEREQALLAKAQLEATYWREKYEREVGESED
jgi:transcriptional regulator with XRE-family HTH domain